MLVVSNTSPLTNLAAIGHFELLHLLFGEIHIAEGVWRELHAGGKSYPGSREVDISPWAHRHTVTDQHLVRALRRDLDAGEAETLALGLGLGADLVLIDEREGRRAAARLGLEPLGVLGILLRCKAKGHLVEVRSPLDALRQDAGFYISDRIYGEVLAVAGE